MFIYTLQFMFVRSFVHSFVHFMQVRMYERIYLCLSIYFVWMKTCMYVAHTIKQSSAQSIQLLID